MKTILPFLLLLSSFINAQSTLQNEKPFAQKTWLAGLQTGRSGANLLSNNLTTQVYGGYFVTNRLMLGVSAGWSREWWRSIIITDVYTAGPSLRYQFTRTRFSPFVAAAYKFGVYTLTSQDYSSGSGTSGFGSTSSQNTLGVQSRALTVGLSIGIISALRADIALNWQDVARFSQPAINVDNGLLQPQFGLNYSFASKR